MSKEKRPRKGKLGTLITSIFAIWGAPRAEETNEISNSDVEEIVVTGTLIRDSAH